MIWPNGIVTLDEEGNPRAGEVTLTFLKFGKRTVWGVEAAVNAYLTEGIVLRGNVNLIDAESLESASGFDQSFNTPEAIVNLGVSATDMVLRERRSTSGCAG